MCDSKTAETKQLPPEINTIVISYLSTPSLQTGKFTNTDLFHALLVNWEWYLEATRVLYRTLLVPYKHLFMLFEANIVETACIQSGKGLTRKERRDRYFNLARHVVFTEGAYIDELVKCTPPKLPPQMPIPGLRHIDLGEMPPLQGQRILRAYSNNPIEGVHVCTASTVLAGGFFQRLQEIQTLKCLEIQTRFHQAAQYISFMAVVVEDIAELQDFVLTVDSPFIWYESGDRLLQALVSKPMDTVKIAGFEQHYCVFTGTAPIQWRCARVDIMTEAGLDGMDRFIDRVKNSVQELELGVQDQFDDDETELDSSKFLISLAKLHNLAVLRISFLGAYVPSGSGIAKLAEQSPNLREFALKGHSGSPTPKPTRDKDIQDFAANVPCLEKFTLYVDAMQLTTKSAVTLGIRCRRLAELELAMDPGDLDTQLEIVAEKGGAKMWRLYLGEGEPLFPELRWYNSRPQCGGREDTSTFWKREAPKLENKQPNRFFRFNIQYPSGV